MDSFGVIRYLPGSGRTPEQDKSAFDGWYTVHDLAFDVYREWVQHYPGYVVAIVKRLEVSGLR